MESLTEKKENDLMQAWKKICKWTKENTAGKFAGGLRLNCPHRVYHWNSLVINEQGEARIYWGTHGSDNPEYVVTENNIYDATNGRFQFGVRTINSDNFSEEEIAFRAERKSRFVASRFEEVILNWPKFKERIFLEMKKNDYVSDFEA